MKKLALFPVLSLVLASCTMMGPVDADYTLVRQPVVKSTAPAYAPAGTAKVTERAGITRTAITLTGMAPQAIYVAHYHKQGKAAEASCSSNGEAIMESKLVAQADKDGKVTLSGFVATAIIKDATYLNVHHASDFNGTPADSGVLCTPVTVK